MPRAFALGEVEYSLISSLSIKFPNFVIIPNLSLNGAERLPALVVAPTRVNFAISIRRDLAAGRFSDVISSAKWL